jgi:hypothetical protein
LYAAAAAAGFKAHVIIAEAAAAANPAMTMTRG